MSGQGLGNYNNMINPSYIEKIQKLENIVDTIVYQENFIVFSEI